jgi:hypothetical protein
VHDELARLAGNAPSPALGNRPEGFPADRAEAFAIYARARDEHEAAAGGLAEVRERTAQREAHSAGPGLGAAVGQQQDRERAAALRLRRAERWLAAWGIPDARQAWTELSARLGRGLPGTGRRRDAERGRPEPPPAAPAPVRFEARRLSDFMAERIWWLAFLAARDHEQAVVRFPDDPGRLYDEDLSPGFRAAMVRAFRHLLDPPDRRFPRIDAVAYKRLHDMVISGQGDAHSWSGDPEESPVSFSVNAPQVSDDLLAGRVAGRPLVTVDPGLPDATLVGLAEGPRGQQRDPGVINWLRRDSRGELTVAVGYDQDEAPGLADAALNAYYAEVATAVDAGGRLRAIARVIRNLHVLHLFPDGNGRLNIYLLLPALLLANGFRPVIHKDASTMFNGGWSLDQIVSLLRAGQRTADPGTGAPGPAGHGVDYSPPPDPRAEVARRVRDSLPGLGWTGRIPGEENIVDLYLGLTHEGTYMGRSPEQVADYLARLIIRDRG